MYFYPISEFRCKDRRIILNTQHAMTIFRFMAMNFPQFTIRMDSILLILDPISLVMEQGSLYERVSQMG